MIGTYEKSAVRASMGRGNHTATDSLVGSHGGCLEKCMISSATINNFRCYKRLELDDLKRVNIFVGDNGSGKTALLEALYLPLASSTDIALRFRQFRGLEGNFNGTPKAIEEAIFADLFYQRDISNCIQISLNGDGYDRRSLSIMRAPEVNTFVPVSDGKTHDTISSAPVVFMWTDAGNNTRAAVPQVSAQGINFGGTGEEFDNFNFFTSTGATLAIETAARYSILSRSGREHDFIDLLLEEYSHINGLSIEVVGGSVALYATVDGVEQKLPLANVSGAFNRLVAILLAMAVRRNGIIMIDEMENGVYYKHHVETWRIILSASRKFNCQIFTTTHSKEWLQALVTAAGRHIDDIGLFRVERSENAQPEVHTFTGLELRDGIEFGVEVRTTEDL